MDVYLAGADDHICMGGGVRERMSRRVCLRKGSAKLKVSEGGAKKEKEGGNKHPFIEFLLWSRSSLSRISFNSLNSPVLARGSEA